MPRSITEILKLRKLYPPIHRMLAKHKLFARLAISLSFHCRDIIKYYLSGGTDNIQKDGEAFVIQNVAPYSSIFVDVGAYKGEWTSTFLEYARRPVRGLLFEPDSEPVGILKKKFGEIEGISIIGAAVGESVERKTFYENSLYRNVSSLVPNFFSDPYWDRGVVEKMVDVTTLDLEVKKHKLDYIDFLKIDAEGYDFYVLKGASQLLSQQKIGVIQFEYIHRWAYAGSTLIHAINFLKSFGYKVFYLRPDGLYNLRYELYGEYFRYTNFIALSPQWNWVVDKLFRGDW